MAKSTPKCVRLRLLEMEGPTGPIVTDDSTIRHEAKARLRRGAYGSSRRTLCYTGPPWETDTKGRIVAMLEDYAEICELVVELVSEGVGDS